eukprot:GFYU01002723.1.p1 GENE.GFYU01002723.1~~GFYU01002723.1.p1  ORF type:complete len:148 (+),score=38.01 GFYU01002723.1:248-691(+)
MPGVLDSVVHLVLQYAVYETFFYWNHRILHHPSLYDAYHKLHHKTYASVGISAIYMTWTDFMLTQMMPIVSGAYLINSPPVLGLLGTTVGSINAIHSHSAYKFPCMPTPESHDDHHSKYLVNFGTGPWDTIMKTNTLENVKAKQRKD